MPCTKKKNDNSQSNLKDDFSNFTVFVDKWKKVHLHDEGGETG